MATRCGGARCTPPHGLSRYETTIECQMSLILILTMVLQVFGIPNCGTCKKAIAWLDSNQIAYEFINTKEHPPNRKMIQTWVDTLGAKAMRNTSGQSYRALGEEKQTWSDGEWVAAFAEDAMLIKRPLFVKTGKAVMVGFRAPEAFLKETLG
jgi:arsenate reductase (glutaredoxin)